MAGQGTNYCSDEDAVIIRGKATGNITLEQWHLDAIDSLIEMRRKQGYKEAQKTSLMFGTGNRIVRLPSKAAGIVSITDSSGRVLSSTEYRLDPGGRNLTRVGISSLYFSGVSCWAKNVEYTVVYLEPDLEQAPVSWRLVAATCAAKVIMWAAKHKEFDIAVTASDQATAGRVSTSAGTSFPADFLEDLRRTIKAGITRAGV